MVDNVSHVELCFQFSEELVFVYPTMASYTNGIFWIDRAEDRELLCFNFNNVSTLVDCPVISDRVVTLSGRHGGVFLDGERLDGSRIEDESYGDYFGTILGSEFGEDFYGRCFSIRFYNRALSDDEVLKNYAIDKARFGIE